MAHHPLCDPTVLAQARMLLARSRCIDKTSSPHNSTSVVDQHASIHPDSLIDQSSLLKVGDYHVHDVTRCLPPKQQLQLLHRLHQANIDVLSILTRAAIELPILSISDKTLRTYQVGLRNFYHFSQFWNALNSSRRPYLPPSIDTILAWFTTFRNGFTATAYASHVKKWCVIFNIDHSAFDDPRAKAALCALKHHTTRKSSPAIRHNLLTKMVDWATTHNDFLIANAMIVAYTFMFRVRDEMLGLHTYDITLRSDHSVSVHLSTRKANRHGYDIVRHCTCSSSPAFCPFRLFTWLLDRSERLTKSALLFHPLTYPQFLAKTKSILHALNVPDSATFGTHSFRRGHCRDMVAAGVPAASILRMGGWRSAAFKEYLDLQEVDALAACQLAMCDVDE
ncbi:hypothetical protein FOZ63_024010 [Perkinsus olseni]|uniref:Tyr recombinase domain-containing protein n=1 Tax=Perkinsus olseni TaxID=32597 RepID=A0A7J6QTK0_PEROL|nr:hypothetical protein FOZ62_022926 [Perkinsus olseni]KAF4710630.1 hypothetical protein FOZ63_024010 [Perkinsus olseni]